MGYSAAAALPEGRSSIGWIVAGLLAIFLCAAEFDMACRQVERIALLRLHDILPR